MTTTTTPTNPRYEGFLNAARHCIVPNDTWYTVEAVAALAAEQDSCVWHASHTLRMAHLAEAGYGTCELCGGVTAPGQADHALCRVRRERHGVEILPQLDATPTCSCARCAK